MIKQVCLLTRKPGMSIAAFREHYETRHRLIGEKYLAGYATRYMRRYPEPSEHLDFDVILEIWYPDVATLEAAGAHLGAPAAQAEIIADEERLFDRSKHRVFRVQESVSELPDVDRSA